MTVIYSVEEGAEIAVLVLPSDLHPETKALVAQFAGALADKLRAAEIKHGFRDHWRSPYWEESCRRDMRAHIDKGDPLDVASYCAFMWSHGWRTNG